jgi:glycosyltransferase involved in cell wall biosynthesis
VHVVGWGSRQHGSFERFLERLAARCGAEGLRTHFVFPEPPASLDENVHVVPFARSLLDYRAWSNLRNVLRKTRATHVHAHFGRDAMLAMQLAKSRKLRPFLSQHVMPSRQWSQRWLTQQAETIFAGSERIATALLALGVPRHKVVRVTLGVDVMAYRPDSHARAATREALGIGDDEKVVLCASPLREGKGIELLPPLAAALAQSPGNVRVLCAGEGPLRTMLEAQSVNIPLQFLGLRQDLPELLAAADLFVVPASGNESLGVLDTLGTIEALSAGLPIVASAVPDRPPIAGDAVQWVTPGDLNALTSACRALLRDPETAHALGSRARAAAVTGFSVDAAVEAYVARYVGPPPPGSSVPRSSSGDDDDFETMPPRNPRNSEEPDGRGRP